MAGDVIANSLEQLQQQRKSVIPMSVSNFDSESLEAEILAGSLIEISGSVVLFSSDETISGWSALAAGICYAYIHGVNLTAHWTSTPPTWSGEKQAYYDATGAHRFFMRALKGAGGEQSQKAIYFSRSMLIMYSGIGINPLADGDRSIRFATDASILLDESEDAFDLSDKKTIMADIEAANIDAAVVTPSKLDAYDYESTVTLKQVTSNTEFYIKKPIMAYAQSLIGSSFLEIYQGGSWRTVCSVNTYGLALNPGRYRLIATGTYPAGLYCTGVYGLASLLAADIVT